MKRPKLSDRIGHFVAIPQAFVEDATISHEAFRLFVVLRSYTSTRRGDDVAFPNYETLKDRTGIRHNKTIAGRLRELEARGWVTRRKRFGQSTVYTLAIPSPDDVLDDAPVSHGMTCSPSPDDAQSVTPSKTNQRNLTRGTELEEAGAVAPLPYGPNVTVSIASAESEVVSAFREALTRTNPASAPNAPIKRKPRAPKFSPANITESDDPRVAAYIELMGRELTPTNAGIICDRVALDGVAEWRDVLTLWAVQEWNPTSIDKMLDRYETARNSRRVKAISGQPATPATPPAEVMAVTGGRRIMGYEPQPDGSMLPIYEGAA